jgi:hypothetical protein
MYDYTTEAQVRKAFWIGFPEGMRKRGWRQNDYSATIRSEWVEFVDMLAKNGHISQALADKVTL